MQTEYQFTLPKGYVDEDGTIHKEGVMRLAYASDEILPLKDPRVKGNENYLTIILLSRVITRLGTIPDVNTRIIERLFVTDTEYLQELYNRINHEGEIQLKTTCPHCSEKVEVSLLSPGG